LGALQWAYGTGASSDSIRKAISRDRSNALKPRTSSGSFPTLLQWLLRCYFAVEDTITPLFVEILALTLFVLTAPILSRHFGLGGLVAARVSAFFLVTGVLIYVLARRKTLLTLDWDLLNFLIRTIVATSGMGAMSWLDLRLLKESFDSGGTMIRLMVAITLIAISGATYLFLGRLLKLSEVRQILTTVRDLLPCNRSPQ
jgi:peptidoglycan biosynthesis protein MviN/MurJ (putative lipid II flippase)